MHLIHPSDRPCQSTPAPVSHAAAAATTRPSARTARTLRTAPGARARTTRPSRPRFGLNFTPRLTPWRGFAILAAAAFALSGCTQSNEPATSPGEGKLKVVATTTQLTDFAARIGGEDIELTGLLSAGASAHHYDPTPADLVALKEADVLIVNGAGLETFIDSAVEASGFTGTVVTAAEGIDLAEAKTITAEAAAETGEGHSDHGHEGEGHSDHDHDHDHEHEGEGHAGHDHDHGDLNPHLWTSPRYASQMVTFITSAFEQADATHAADYRKNAETYQEKLTTLDQWITEQFEQVPQNERVLVSGHDSLRYYLHDYAITFAGSILPSFEDNAEPSAADIDELVNVITRRGIKAIFTESSMNPALANTIATEAGIQILDSHTLYADSVGTAGSGAQSYVGATIHNTQTILKAWGFTPQPVPDSLLE